MIGRISWLYSAWLLAFGAVSFVAIHQWAAAERLRGQLRECMSAQPAQAQEIRQ